jgi:ferric-dicitrate binding protein FerR (iron transport regulator)
MAVTANESMAQDRQKAVKAEPDAQRRRQRRKNLALAAVLAIFAILIYFVAIVRMSGGG